MAVEEEVGRLGEGRPLLLADAVGLPDEDPAGDSGQGVVGAEEDQPEDECDAADRGGQGFDPPQQQPDGDGQERGEDDLRDMHEQPAPDLVLQLRVDVTLAGGVNQGEDCPQERCPEHDNPSETEARTGSVHRSPFGAHRAPL